jgi:AcrR family transcriptional regulator
VPDPSASREDHEDVAQAPEVRRGRPRDPEVERKIREAAVTLYADAGWSGFSIEGVAKLAGVGKGSIYLRWSSAAALLLDAFRTELKFVDDVDTGSLRGDLQALAHQISRVYEGDHARAYLRTQLEGSMIPGFDLYFDFQRTEMKISRAIVRRAVKRQQLPIDTNVTMVLDALSGGLLVHALSTPEGLVSVTRRRQYPDDLVEFVMRAARAT